MVQIQGESGLILMGIIVDGVSEVLNLTGAEVEDTPDFGADFSTPYILGMAKAKGKVKILLDIDRVLTTQEVQGLGSLVG